MRKAESREWRLGELMNKNGIRYVADLHRKLKKMGIEISQSQLSRWYGDKPKRINVEVMEALTTVLNCSLDDLLKPPQRTPNQRIAEVKTPPKRVSVSGSSPNGIILEEIVGPRAKAFPIPARNS